MRPVPRPRDGLALLGLRLLDALERLGDLAVLRSAAVVDVYASSGRRRLSLSISWWRATARRCPSAPSPRRRRGPWRLPRRARGAGEIIGPNLATPSEPPIAPKLAAIATQAASSAKRRGARRAAQLARLSARAALECDDRCRFGDLRRPAAGSAPRLWLRSSASIFGSAFARLGLGLGLDLGRFGFASTFGASASILGAAASRLRGFASGAIDGASVRSGSARSWASHRWTWGAFPME